MRPDFLNEFICAGCGRTGHALWDGGAESAHTLTEISVGFTFRPDVQLPDITLIVCESCGTAQSAQRVFGRGPDASASGDRAG